MTQVDRVRLKVMLGQHYHRQRPVVDGPDLDALVASMMDADRHAEKAVQPKAGTAAFVAAQVRFTPGWLLAAQVGIALVMFCIAVTFNGGRGVRWGIGMLAALQALTCMPTLYSSKQYGMAELEYASCFGAARILVARLIIAGCITALVLGFMVVMAAHATKASALDVVLWICPPYFFSCAGVLCILRKASPDSALIASVAWVAACCAVLLFIAGWVPDAYAQTSLAVWALAAAAALAWLVREVIQMFAALNDGIDAYMGRRPQAAIDRY